MDSQKDATENLGASRCSSRAFVVGDTIIVNDVEQPCGKFVAVVVAINQHMLKWCYLKDDPTLEQFDGSWAFMDEATLTQDFGVQICNDLDGYYWLEQKQASKAKYPDGEPRRWQEYHPEKHKYRAKLFDLVRPF